MSSCPTCSKEFEELSNMRRHHAQAHGESISGFQTECTYCGSSIVKEEKSQASGRSFCDANCLNEWQRETDENEGQNSPTWEGKVVEKECLICGEEFTYPESHTRERVTCSYRCLGVLNSERYRGEDNPNWKGGHPEYYGKDWPEHRELAREKYDDTCQNCGKQSDEPIPVHHIRPVRSFDNPNDAHFQENLTQVCWTCHQKVEQLSVEEQLEELT